MYKHLLLLTAISAFPLFGAGCGASVSPGVADGPDEPAPELTAEEEQAEAKAARAAAGME